MQGAALEFEGPKGDPLTFSATKRQARPVSLCKDCQLHQQDGENPLQSKNCQSRDERESDPRKYLENIVKMVCSKVGAYSHFTIAGSRAAFSRRLLAIEAPVMAPNGIDVFGFCAFFCHFRWATTQNFTNPQTLVHGHARQVDEEDASPALHTLGVAEEVHNICMAL